MSLKVFNLSFPSELVEIIDKQAKMNYSTRTEYVKQAILTRLKTEKAIGVDEAIKPKTLGEHRREQLKEFLEDQGYETPSY